MGQGKCKADMADTESMRLAVGREGGELRCVAWDSGRGVIGELVFLGYGLVWCA